MLPTLLRNALLRLPTTVLVVASPGLGEQPPTPERAASSRRTSRTPNRPPGPSSARPPRW
ncbi:hypothetical protein ABIE67_008527 [Streptomyces sp. V4I8]|uniref:hypothetical protein n=1 Tax=Streptomyces sp. V4I8 TaxID=3156469 RepID=UPI003514A09C